MKQMSSITFPDGSSYEVVDSTARLTMCINDYTQSGSTLIGTGIMGKFKATGNGVYESFIIDNRAYTVKNGEDSSVELISGDWYMFLLDGDSINFKRGGAGLNFKVIGTTVEPVSPTENTIWINTDTVIGEYQFSATQPTTRANGTALQSGDVWIKTDKYSKVKFNTLKKNGVIVNISSCSQYINGTWTYVKSNVYQSGEWKNGEIFYLYHNGDTCDEVTGGWVLDNKFSSITDTVTFDSDCITMTGGGASDKKLCLRTSNYIDLTNVKTIKFTLSVTTADRVICYVGNESMSYIGALPKIQTNSTAIKTYSLDVSTLSGEYYVGLCTFWSDMYTLTSKFYKVEFVY